MKPVDPEILTGMENPTERQIRLVRLDICSHCPKNQNGICLSCGCSISRRTANMESFCPLLKW